jgi:IclR family transcriptional regulator, acetate operon repressor
VTAVKSALRTLQILEIFAEQRRPLTLGELARHMETPKSSCLALLGTLAERGYLYRVGLDGAYYPTRRWLDNASQVAEHDTVAAEVKLSLRRLRDATGETAIDAVLVGDRSVYLDVVESIELVRFTARAGDSKPLHASASGRAQLGVLEPAEREAVMRKLTLERITARTRVTPKALAQTVQEESTRGWSANYGEFRPDVISIASGLRLGATVHSLVVAAPYQRVEKKVDKIGQAVRAEALALARRLQGQVGAANKETRR